MQPTQEELPAVGAVLGGKYRVERILGEGGMGIVFEAVHAKLGQKVAVKMLLPALVKVPELVGRFEREARAAAQLRHRNTARVVDVDVTPAGVPYMVMELLHGHDLESELETRGALPIGEAVFWVIQACSAMTEAHRLGIVHRDLKPSNLFLSAEADGSVCIKVLDFGISKVQSDDVRITSTQTQMGTPLYMSPEQVRSAKNVDHRTDIWSLGVILFELIAGRAPYVGSAAGIGAAIVNDPPPPLRSLRGDAPEELERVIERALAKDPAARFGSTHELAQALAPFSSTPVVLDSVPRAVVAQPRPSNSAIESAATLAAPIAQSAKSPTGGSWAVQETKPPRSSRAALLGVIAAILVVAGVGGGIAFMKSSASATGTASASTATATTTAIATATATVTAAATTAPLASASVAPTIAATTNSTVPQVKLTATTGTGGTKPPPSTTTPPSHTGTTKPPDNPARL